MGVLGRYFRLSGRRRLGGRSRFRDQLAEQHRRLLDGAARGNLKRSPPQVVFLIEPGSMLCQKADHFTDLVLGGDRRGTRLPKKLKSLPKKKQPSGNSEPRGET